MSSPSLPFPASESAGVFSRYHWPVSWITLADVGAPPFVLGFRLILEQAEEATVRFHVTADERYELYLDGVLVARGPERGSPEAWYYTTLDLPITTGRHVLFARVWALGDKAPHAQFTVRPGFLLGVEDGSKGGADARRGTGLAAWEVKRLDGYGWLDHPDIGFDGFTGKKLLVDGNRYPWGIERGEGEGWTNAVVNSKAMIWLLRVLSRHRKRRNPAGRIVMPGARTRSSTSMPRFSASGLPQWVLLKSKFVRNSVRCKTPRAGWCTRTVGSK